MNSPSPYAVAAVTRVVETAARVQAPAQSKHDATRGAFFTRFEYDFDRNALVASVASGPSYLAVTKSGHLLRFDRTSFTLTGELRCGRAAVSLAKVGERLLVGFESGRIAGLDAATLALDTVGSVPGVPVWLGAAPDGELVTTYARRGFDSARRAAGRLGAFRVRFLASGREVLVDRPTTFFRDSVGRLWLGADHGEWGGGLEMVDLRTAAHVVLEKVGNVYGISEPLPGEVWASGGVQHMGLVESFVDRVTAAGRAKHLFFARGFLGFVRADHERWFAKTQPHAPVTHVVRAPWGKLLAFAYGEVFETDEKWKAFRLAARLSLRQAPGRPDAVGSYSGLEAVLAEADHLVLATAQDGFLTLRDGFVTPHVLPGQIGPNARALSVARGLVVFGQPSSLLGTDGWRSVPTRDWQRLEAEEPAPEGTDQALVEGELKRLSYRDKNQDRVRAEALGAKVGLKGDVSFAAVDAIGRTWLAGNGLWFLDASGQTVAVHPSLPFMRDAQVADFAFADGRLVLALGARGLVRLDPRDVRELGPSSVVPPLDTWDGAQSHEPKPTDGAVFVMGQAFEPRDAGTEWDLQVRTANAVEASPLPSYELEGYSPPLQGSSIAQYGAADPDAVARVVVEALRGEPRAAEVRIFVRHGAEGAPLVEVAR